MPILWNTCMVGCCTFNHLSWFLNFQFENEWSWKYGMCNIVTSKSGKWFILIWICTFHISGGWEQINAWSLSFSLILQMFVYTYYIVFNLLFVLQELQSSPTDPVWLLSSIVSFRLFESSSNFTASRTLDVSQSCVTLLGMHKWMKAFTSRVIW